MNLFWLSLFAERLQCEDQGYSLCERTALCWCCYQPDAQRHEAQDSCSGELLLQSRDLTVPMHVELRSVQIRDIWMFNSADEFITTLRNRWAGGSCNILLY